MKKIAAVVLIICLFVKSGLVVKAETIDPTGSFEQVSRDGTRVFSYTNEWDPETRNRTTFASVYTNDTERRLIYTIENFKLVHSYSPFFTDDMSHMVHTEGKYALTFFANGERLLEHERSDFIEDYASWYVCDCSSCENTQALWVINWRMINLDSDALEFTIETDEGRTIVFDMTNGEIILDTTDESETNNRMFLISITALSALVTISAVIISLKINKRGKLA